MSKLSHSLKVALIPSLVAVGLSCNMVQAHDKTPDIEENIKIIVKSDQSNSSNVDINVNGDSQTFNLPELADGETKTLTTKSGKEIILKKVNGETLIDLDGKMITLGAPKGMMNDVEHHKVMKWVSKDGEGHSKHTMMKGHMDDKVIVVGDLSEVAQKAVKDALKSQGVDKEVIFPSTGQTESKVLFIKADESNIFTTEDGSHIELEVEHDTDIEIEAAPDGSIKKQYRIIKVKKGQ